MATVAAAFAGKAVATSTITFFVNKAFSYLDEYRKAEGMEAVKEQLVKSLHKIQAVLDVVSPDNIREESVSLEAWLWEFRDATEEAEDALEVLEYHELEDKAKNFKASDSSSSFFKFKRKIINPVSKCVPRPGTLKRLQKALEGLDKAASTGTKDFLGMVDHLGGSAHFALNNETSSYLPATMRVFGREEDMNKVVQWVIRTSPHGNHDPERIANKVSFVALIGMGGIGKSTLAQLIYNNAEVTNSFDLKIWVFVSARFDAAKITSKIIENASRAKPRTETLEPLQQILSKKLDSKKFLLVLDDVWEDSNSNEWEKLLAPLKVARQGSKILITSRMQSVADMASIVIGSQVECLNLTALDEANSSMLFNHHAFANLNCEDFPSLRSVGEAISKKLRGCPLVIKVVGAHLRDNLIYQYWKYFLQKDLLYANNSVSDIMKILRLSYYHLPTELQVCFRYCSIFPQGYLFEKEELITLWMGSGLIQQCTLNGAQRPEDVGEKYFLQLVAKSLFILAHDANLLSEGIGSGGDFLEENIGSEVQYYVMHDLIHQLAHSVSSGECIRIDSAGCTNVVSTVRHLGITDLSSLCPGDLEGIYVAKKLRTLIIKSNSHVTNDTVPGVVPALEKLVESIKGLRLLSIEKVPGFSLPDKISSSKHLRYLKLRAISEDKISRVSQLYHLQFLNCYNYMHLEPKRLMGFGYLLNLRYVNFGGFPISRLTCLQELSQFSVQPREGFKLNALKNLADLRKLEVSGIENAQGCKEAQDAKLKQKAHLVALSVQWSSPDTTGRREDAMILDKLEPHANLEMLEISGYSGTRLPTWIHSLDLIALETLMLSQCINCEFLPALGKLGSLKHLKLDGLTELKRIGHLSSGSASKSVEPSSSQTITQIQMESDIPEDMALPPILSTLVIERCPKMRELPLLPFTLVKLILEYVGLIFLPRMHKRHLARTEMMRSNPGKLLLRIHSCHDIISLAGSFLEEQEHMRNLSVLSATCCERLEHLPLPFAGMISLRDITFSECPKLVIPTAIVGDRDNILPKSLKTLSIAKCGELDHPLVQSLLRLTNLTELRLLGCQNLLSLPSAQVFRSLIALKDMSLSNCEKLSSLGGLGALQSLRALSITRCMMLVSVQNEGDEQVLSTDCSLAIDRLLVDLPTLLLVEPLRRFCRCKKLVIEDASGMETLPEEWLLQNRGFLWSLEISRAEILEVFPSSMQVLGTLHRLTLADAACLQLLPDQLPPCLEWLSITGCSDDFREWCRTQVCSGLLSRVSRARIGRMVYINGRISQMESSMHTMLT